jgi:hypothetical protein
MKIQLSKTIFFLLLLFSGVHAIAQPKNKNTLKKPVLHSYWGNTKGGNIPLEKVLQLILDSTITVVSDKKEIMTVARFFVHYRSLDSYEDETTGKLVQRYNSEGDYIRERNTLSDTWRKSIFESVKAGDEVIITELYVRDKEGYLFLAPEIKISVK